jgi:TPR repeat protein
MLALRDISAARRLYTYAAEAGSGPAAAALGRTYDPTFLDRMGAQGIRPDPALAARWYRQAIALGESQAATALSRLEQR